MGRPYAEDISDTTEARRQLWDLIKDIKFAMFTTRHGNGHLHSRPMTTQNSSVDEDSNLWFFMSRSNGPLDDIGGDTEVNVSYADPGKDSYVSVSGRAAVVDDTAKKQQLWSKMSEAWFPGGVNDPDLALVRVRISHAHFWDVKSNKLVQMFKMAKAAVTGKPPENMGEHAEIRMN